MRNARVLQSVPHKCRLPAKTRLRQAAAGERRPRGLCQTGELTLDELITRRYSIDEAPQAFDDLINGRNARGVIVF